MNEKIRKLVEQVQHDSDAIHYYDPVFVEKLAELIVRECAKAIIDSIQTMPPCRMKANIAYSSTVIKEHFGIEASQGWICPQCNIDRTKMDCPKGHTAAVTGQCPMYGIAYGVKK